MTELTHDRVREALSYDPLTGILTWRIKPKFTKIKVGDRAGSIGHKGYRYVGLDGEEYREHILIWFHVTGEWPPSQIDHADTEKANNRWVNLRLADCSQNHANRPITKSNSTGLKGVSKRKYACGMRYRAQISHRGTNTHLGLFKTPEEAHAAYCRAAREMHGEFSRQS